MPVRMHSLHVHIIACKFSFPWPAACRSSPISTWSNVYVGAALPPLTKSDRRCYYSLEKVTMICSTTKRLTAGSRFNTCAL